MEILKSEGKMKARFKEIVIVEVKQLVNMVEIESENFLIGHRLLTRKEFDDNFEIIEEKAKESDRRYGEDRIY